jgi:hypothetical protein
MFTDASCNSFRQFYWNSVAELSHALGPSPREKILVREGLHPRCLANCKVSDLTIFHHDSVLAAWNPMVAGLERL